MGYDGWVVPMLQWLRTTVSHKCWGSNVPPAPPVVRLKTALTGHMAYCRVLDENAPVTILIYGHSTYHVSVEIFSAWQRSSTEEPPNVMGTS